MTFLHIHSEFKDECSYLGIISRVVEIKRKKIFYILLFLVTLIVDSLLIIYSVTQKYSLILYAMLTLAIVGIIGVHRIWNKDERTDTALDASARSTINLFVIIASTLGILLLIISDVFSLNFWEVGATLIVSVLVLVYLHLILATNEEGAMR